MLVAITTSGRSESIRRAVKTAHAMKLIVIGMTGAKGAEFAATCDVALVTPSAVTPNIQEGHIAMGHAFCLLVERALFPHGAPVAGPRPTPRKPRGVRKRVAAAATEAPDPASGRVPRSRGAPVRRTGPGSKARA